MKKGHLQFETVLMSITLLIGLPALLIPGEFSLIFLLWMIVLGVCQVVHSLIISVNYWEIRKVRTHIIIYWVISAIDLTTLLSGATVGTNFFFFIILPMLLAGYLWFITFDGKEYTSTVELTLEGEIQDR